MLRSLGLLVLLALVPACATTVDDVAATDQAAAGDQNPALGTPERAALVRAIHAQLDPKLGNQKNEYVVSHLKSADGFSYMEAEIRGAGGAAIDWKKTEIAALVDAGFFGTPSTGIKVTFTAAMKAKAGPGYDLVDIFVGAGPRAGEARCLPASLYPPFGDGDGDGEGDGDGDGDGDGEGPSPLILSSNIDNCGR